jgi:hypothetical protein
MGILRLFKYKYILNNRRKRYASLAISIALAHASFGQVRYRSLGNGMADITLALDENQKFELDFNDIADQKHYKMRGKWEIDHNNYVLKFRRAKPDLNALFTSNTGFSKPAAIMDRKTISFPAFQKGLMIWGIYCEKNLA